VVAAGAAPELGDHDGDVEVLGVRITARSERRGAVAQDVEQPSRGTEPQRTVACGAAAAEQTHGRQR
jgi:hypothetical protein